MSILKQITGAATNTNKKQGTDNEKELAKYLTAWSKNKHSFYSQIGSGAIHLKGVGVLRGDILTAADFPLCIETKHIKKMNFTPSKSGFLRSNSIIKTYWHQTLTDAVAANKIPVFVGRSDTGPWHFVSGYWFPKCETVAGLKLNHWTTLYIYKLSDLRAAYSFKKFLKCLT